ncbi:MAG: toxin-antitoxin system HicB family antitoxin [Myxococcota bacterium]
MGTLSLRLPDSLHKKLAALAREEGISINQLINSAVSEKLAALMTEGYLEERARRGSRSRFDRAMAKVADIEPEDVDRLPDREPGSQKK